jgi:anti-sigma regulatory factor (Ser/Thr protein kinase)
VTAVGESSINMKKHFERSMASLDGMFRFIDSYVEQNGIDSSVAFAISLASEEIFVNMIKHNPQGSEGLSIEMVLEKDRLIVHLTDHDSQSFDISLVEASGAAETEKDLKPGGRGLQLVRSVVDDLEYSHEGSVSKITIVKKLESTDV